MTPQDYRDLIQAFLDQNLSIEEFEKQYLAAFKAEPGGMDRRLYEILEDLFEDVDAYSPLWSPADENWYRITEPTLRKEAQNALHELDALISSG